jgi:hypothetical protein
MFILSSSLPASSKCPTNSYSNNLAKRLLRRSIAYRDQTFKNNFLKPEASFQRCQVSLFITSRDPLDCLYARLAAMVGILAGGRHKVFSPMHIVKYFACVLSQLRRAISIVIVVVVSYTNPNVNAPLAG